MAGGSLNESVPHKVAVRTMVALALRSGDLRVVFSGASRAREGVRIHRRLQKSRPEYYTAEVPVNFNLQAEAASLEVSGRIDGVYVEPGQSTVEEIKTTVRDLDEICRVPDPVHMGQLKCYAYMYAVAEQLTSIRIQLTYYQIETGLAQAIVETCSLEGLAASFNDIAGRYLEKVGRFLGWPPTRNRSIEALAFPFLAFRDGQREMAVAVYRTIRDKKQLLIQAATGIGKTMGVLFPAVKALAGVQDAAILYLTARTTGRMAAQKAFEVLRKSGLKAKTVTLTAKDKICFLAERSCNPEDCEFARGYYDRIDAAVGSIYGEDDFSRDRIEQTAHEFRVCPFELSLELVSRADCIICDYNYAFDPRVSLKRLLGESGRRYFYLVDEAHNLVDRSREMFSAQIEKRAILALRRNLGKQLPAVFKSLGKINSCLLAARKKCEQLPDDRVYSQKELPADLLIRVTDFVHRTESWLSENSDTPFRKELLECYFNCTHFLKTADQYSTDYVTFVEQENREVRVKLFCLDPARRLEDAMDPDTAAVFFSATMTPAGYFRRLFGCPADTACLQIGSPFPAGNLGLFVANRISTFYRSRSETLKKLSELLLALVLSRRGNYLLFFPSYAYMDMVHAHIVNLRPELNCLVQKPEMKAGEKKAFLGEFTKKSERGLVGFAVLGGIFGEGIDLEGEQLSGAAVVGVGLPGITYENELIRAYFNETEGAGFQYAYQYPGINRVLQGGGRVIRTGSDRGVILLVDQRYATHRYRSLLPGHWLPVIINTKSSLAAALGDFWGHVPKEKGPGA